MRPNEIKVGATYVNRGAGRTRRKVLAIGDEHRPSIWLSGRETQPDEPGVLFETNKGKQFTLYLSSFASWAGKEVQ